MGYQGEDMVKVGRKEEEGWILEYPPPLYRYY
jgi:hypothetical protein